jgi:ribosomal protein S18 acetylase RimI-like enzyme
VRRASIESRVLSCRAFDPAGSFVALRAGRVAGFCFAAMAGAPARDGYLCALAVDPRWRRRAIGSRLLTLAQRYLALHGARRALVTFEGNPMPLLIGIPPNNETYPFFLNRGFRTYDRSLLQVMVQDTTRFRLAPAVQTRIRRLASRGIRIEHAEPRHRRSLDRLLAANFPSWHHGVMANMTGDPPQPVLVAARGGRVLGFAGPFGVGPLGAGHFHSFGVHPAARGLGVGLALFHTLCAQLKARGAKSVSLTTHLDNPAQEIYLRAGYRVRCVADCGMRKELVGTAGRERGRRRKKAT